MANPLNICLWYDGKAKEAAEFYKSIFEDCKIHTVTQMVVTFEINGTKFMGLNGGPMFKFNEAFSLVVNCDSQKEIDHYWEKLLADGGEESRCGWLKDKFGMSWQIIPAKLGEWMSKPDKAQRVMAEVMKMAKLDIATLENA